MFFPQKRICRSSERREDRRKQNALCILRAARLQQLMKAHQLKSLCDLKFLTRIRHLAVRQDDRFFLGKMKDNPLLPQLRITAEQPQEMIERQRKPAAVLPRVQIDIRIHKDGEQHEQRPEKERIHKKFAHIRNMGEFSEIMKCNCSRAGNLLPSVLCKNPCSVCLAKDSYFLCRAQEFLLPVSCAEILVFSAARKDSYFLSAARKSACSLCPAQKTCSFCLIQSILTISVSSSPFKKSGIS